MRVITKIGDITRVIVDEYTVILICNENYWYNITEIRLGTCDCGGEIEVFDTVNEANQYITEKKLSKFEGTIKI